jgi:hypothetical protein
VWKIQQVEKIKEIARTTTVATITKADGVKFL